MSSSRYIAHHISSFLQPAPIQQTRFVAPVCPQTQALSPTNGMGCPRSPSRPRRCSAENPAHPRARLSRPIPATESAADWVCRVPSPARSPGGPRPFRSRYPPVESSKQVGCGELRLLRGATGGQNVRGLSSSCSGQDCLLACLWKARLTWLCGVLGDVRMCDQHEAESRYGLR